MGFYFWKRRPKIETQRDFGAMVAQHMEELRQKQELQKQQDQARRPRKGQRRQYQPRTTPYQPQAQRQQRPAPEPEPQFAEILQRASKGGRMTGFEPREMAKYYPTFTTSAKGVAGLGLFGSDFSASSVYQGQVGETNFFKALSKTDLVDSYMSYWSVRLPAPNRPLRPDDKYTTDVDCVLVEGNTIHLIDLKNYASGAVTWHNEQESWLLCRDDVTGKQVGKPRKMSRNMAMALSRFQALFPTAEVTARVTLIPTNFGEATVEPGTCWPGDIPLETLSQTLDSLRIPHARDADHQIDAGLTSLLSEQN